MKIFLRPHPLVRVALLLSGLAVAPIGNGTPAMAQTVHDLPVIPAPRSWKPAEGAYRPDPARNSWTDGVERERDPDLAPEEYRLEIAPEGIRLTAGGDPGFGHGLTTLDQMAAVGGTLPCGVIEDGPRFGWRGLLLDCGRHFMPVEVIKGVIDRLAMYKFNVLHWHLTEDQGWRLEIPGHPLLTEIGAWRIGSDGNRYGGFYTAADVAEILDYAAARHIRVVPEIEMPGHALAALAAYPELSCTSGPFAVETQWGIHEDVFCAGREETFTFLEDVLTHVMKLFPGEFIHVGGDEVPKDRWRACPRCQARIETEGLANEDGLQSWFIARIEKFLAANGRRLIGWDEILEGDLAARTRRPVVQAWRGHHEATVAARAGLEVIVSPTSHAYLDYDPSRLDLARVFSFEPVPAKLDDEGAGRILGGAANLWTEYVPPDRVDTMLFPRLAAMAEALWTADPDRNFFDFWDRWLGQAPVLDRLGAKAGPEARPLTLEAKFEDGVYRLEAVIDEETREAFAGHRFEVARGEAPPGRNADSAARPEDRGLPPLGPGDIGDPEWDWSPRDGGALHQARLFVDGRPYGAPAVLEISPHLAVGITPGLVHKPSRRYPGGLTDGLRGGRDHQGRRWAGFEGLDLDAVIDLGEDRRVSSVAIRCLQDANAWILLPTAVSVSWSLDGEDWTESQFAGHDVSDRVQDVIIREFSFDLGGISARYLRLRAENFGALPDWHPGRGQPGWIFADEIVVR